MSRMRTVLLAIALGTAASGAALAADFTPPRVGAAYGKDAAVLAEKAKVRLVADPALAARLPLRVAVVELTLVDGRRLENRVETVRGTAANPMSSDEVVDKARDLLAPTLGRARTERLIAATLGIEKVDARADLARLLQPA